MAKNEAVRRATIQYCLNQWEKLLEYLKDGRLKIDT
ncbi:IS66 family transposase [Sporosarcina sp. Te-1]|nr:IS66 family transposase [Sporosarcina sp. Te-1]